MGEITIKMYFLCSVLIYGYFIARQNIKKLKKCVDVDFE